MYFSEPPVAFPSSRSFRRSTSWQPRSSASQRWAATSILNLHGAVLHLPAPANGKKRPLTKESITHFHPFEAVFSPHLNCPSLLPFERENEVVSGTQHTWVGSTGHTRTHTPIRRGGSVPIARALVRVLRVRVRVRVLPAPALARACDVHTRVGRGSTRESLPLLKFWSLNIHVK
jgi:hypothetical protein